jgi:hypothetical protein
MWVLGVVDSNIPVEPTEIAYLTRVSSHRWNVHRCDYLI